MVLPFFYLRLLSPPHQMEEKETLEKELIRVDETLTSTFTHPHFQVRPLPLCTSPIMPFFHCVLLRDFVHTPVVFFTKLLLR